MPKSKHQVAGRVRSVYEFIKANRDQYSVQAMCRILEVAPSGYYDWLLQPISNRAQEDARLLRLIRASFVASHGIYGAPRVFLDLREAGETCSKHRVARLMRQANLRALHGYRTRRWAVGKPSVLIPNLLQRQFTATKANAAWVTDITYIRTWQGWLYLAVVTDLYSCLIVGWAAQSTIHRELVLNAVLMAVRRRRPRGTLIHSDQGTQFGGDAWRRFCRSNHLEPSMSRKARHRSGSRQTSLVDGMPLQESTDASGWRELLAGRPVHAGDTLYLLTSLGWYPVRYETNVPRKNSFLCLSLPGVPEDTAILVPRDARFAWPDELK